MQTSTVNDERGLSFLAAACYLISITVCGLAAYAVARVTATATADAVLRLYQSPGIF